MEDEKTENEQNENCKECAEPLKRSDIFVKFVDAMGGDLFRTKRPKLITSKVVRVNTAGSMHVGKEHTGKVVRLIICEAEPFEEVTDA
jgi:hypothetical protein